MSSRRSNISQARIVFGIAVLAFIAFSILVPGFLSTGNVSRLLQNVSISGILTMGMALSIIGRGIDLSMVAVAQHDGHSSASGGAGFRPLLCRRLCCRSSVSTAHARGTLHLHDGRQSTGFAVARQGRIVEEFSPQAATEETIMYAAVH